MTLDRYAIFQRLNVEPRGIFIVDVQIGFSGTLSLDCRYDPEQQEPFQIIFEGCKNIVWDWETDNAASHEIADVISIFLGQGDYQERAIIHTDLFEMTLSYQRLIIQKSQIMWADTLNKRIQPVTY
jgi:hypothetical protein